MNESQRLRVEDISANLRQAHERIDAACSDFGREGVTLIVVTKTHPVSDLVILSELGVRDVGENRDQEARTKSVELAQDFTWHMIGQIQRNKINSIVRWADVIHTCDREELVDPIERSAASIDKDLDIFIQVNVDPFAPAGRGGIHPQKMMPLARRIAEAPHLRLRGLMAVAPHPSTGVDPEHAFSQVQQLSAQLQEQFPFARDISAGMSADLEAAIKYGATHLRLGSAILGDRPPVQ